MAEYTPNPKSASPTPEPWRAENSIIMAGGVAIAQCYQLEGMGPAERHANARHMAAAPELLAALERLTAAGHAYHCHSGWKPGYPCTCGISDGLAAIAKARGVSE